MGSIHNIRDGETWPRDVKQLAHIIRLMSDGTRIGTPVELRGTALNQVALQVPRAGWRVETVSYLEFPWSSAELNAVSYLSPSMRTVHLTSLPCYKTFNSITYRVKPQVLALAYLSSVISLHRCPHSLLSRPSHGLSVLPALYISHFCRFHTSPGCPQSLLG